VQASMFCPNAIAWGDVATWVAGLASFLAVVVALWIARYSARDAKRRESEAKHNAAKAMSVVIHGELVPLAGAMQVLLAIRRHYGEQFTAAQFGELTLGLDKISTPALDRFLERLDVFAPLVAGQLMIVYRGVLSIQGAIRTPGIDGGQLTNERALVALNTAANMAESTERWIYEALDSLSAIAREAGFTVIATAAVRDQAVGSVE
jgi:hypothetical protein